MGNPDLKPCGQQGAPRSRRRPVRNIRRDAICSELREAYAAIMREPLPERFRGLFDRNGDLSDVKKSS